MVMCLVSKLELSEPVNNSEGFIYISESCARYDIKMTSL